MTFAVEVSLLTGRYDAATADDRDTAEWPPHPARLFCALVASAREPVDWEALRWLERQEPPAVHAAADPISTSRSGYVVTNSRNYPGGSQFHPGRGNQLRSRQAVSPRAGAIRFTWSADIDPPMHRILLQLCQRVPYVGRSTGVALVTLSTSPTTPADLQTWWPSELAEADASLRVPYPGYVDALRAAFDSGRSAWEVARSRGYRLQRPAQDPPVATAPSPYTDFVIFQFDGFSPAGRLAPAFAEAMRRAVMCRVPDPLPAALHGHDADNRPHVAFLALPFVGAHHADGRLLGLAVALPTLPEPERRQILRGILGPADEEGRFRLQVPRIGEVSLRYQPGLVRPWALNPERWRKGSTTWTTATPVVLDRYPKPGKLESEIVRTVRTSGFPEPADLEISTAPLQDGAIRMIPRDLPERTRGRQFRHIRVTFDRTVAGPMLIGAGRYLGVGLLTPAGEQ